LGAAPKVFVLRKFTFPESFLFGTATSATQIEGSCTTTDWAAFSHEPGNIADGTTPNVAADHWNRWEEDVALQKELGFGAHRMSIEWARVERAPGDFDHQALDRYREEVGALVDAGIEPMVTLHHFSLPQWVSAKGGLMHPDLPELMERYTRKVAEALGDLVHYWITINEPNIVTTIGHLLGLWPPKKRSLVATITANHALMRAHAQMYDALHELVDGRGRDASVGVAHHLRLVSPHDENRGADRMAARMMDMFFNETFPVALCEGHVPGMPAFLVPSARAIHGKHDFFGLNYYGRDDVRFAPLAVQDAFLERHVQAGVEITDLGWEVYPDGLRVLLDKWHRRAGLPIFVTENGLADSTDHQRPSFLVRHLAAVAEAIESGVDVLGYMHWSLLDNFEWAEGCWPRFGLIEVDYETQRRRVRPSARLYARIAATREISTETWARHGQAPTTVRRQPFVPA
jgi:beta-glucosidase